MKIIQYGFMQPPKPKPPSWWRTFGLPTGTVVEHKGARWILTELWFSGGYEGRTWKQVNEEK